MINLIKNELIKIFHKKAIYIYTIIVLFMLVLVSVVSNNLNTTEDTGISNSYTDSLEENLHNYNLSNADELNMYVGDRVIIDVNRLSADYNFKSAERYYIENVIEPLIYNKYQLEYVEKDVEAAKTVQTEIEDAVKRLDNFDWKIDIEKKKEQLETEIKELENNKINEVDKNYLESLRIKLWCLNYRLDNEIPYSYASSSTLIDEYEDSAIQYLSVVKDESLIKDKEQLTDKRRIEEDYYVSLYKLENKLTNDSQNMIEYIIESISYIDGLIIVAIIIISGSIISEEFSKGTIKQLLIKPYSRWKILTSKIVASLIAIFIFILLYNSVFILANCYEYSDFTSIFGTNVVYDFNLEKVREISVLGQCFYGFISVLPAYLIIFFLVIFVGVLTTNSVATICTGFGVYLLYDLLVVWLKPKLLSYLPFYCWDLTPYMFGGISNNKYATFGKSLIVDIITIGLLIVLSFIFFKKKDIKNQ